MKGAGGRGGGESKFTHKIGKRTLGIRTWGFVDLGLIK